MMHALTTLAAVWYTVGLWPVAKTESLLFAGQANVSGACPCVVEMHITASAGLGHRLTEWLMGARLAAEINCTLMPPNQTLLFGAGTHGAYLDLASLLFDARDSIALPAAQSFSAAPWRTYAVEIPLSRELQNITRDVRRCHARFQFHSRACNNGIDKWCFQSQWTFAPAIMHEFRTRFMERVPRTYCTNITAAITVHLRVGDLVVNWGIAYYRAVFASVVAVLARNNLHHRPFMFVQECAGCAPNSLHASHHAMFHRICADLQLTCRFEPHLGVYESLRHMVCTELLVTSGSSFSMIAAHITNAPVVFVRNKDKKCYACESAPWNALPALDGRLSPLELTKLDDLLRIRLQARRLRGVSNATALNLLI